MNVHAPGRPVKCVINTNDASSVQTFTVYDVATQEVITFGTNDIFVLYLLSISNGDSAVVASVFDDLDGAGDADNSDTLFKKSMNAKEQAGFAYTRGLPLKRIPKFLASTSSANTSVVLYGDIQE